MRVQDKSVVRAEALFPAMIVVFTSLAIGVTPALSQNRASVSICDVLMHLHKYRNRVVAVKARLVGDHLHGYYLSDRFGDEPCPGNVKSGWTSPSTLYMNWPGSADLPSPPPFGLDIKAVQAINSAIQSMETGSTRSISGIFVGQIRTKPNARIYCDPKGGCDGDGFGQRGMHAAELVIETVRNLTDVRTSGKMGGGNEVKR